MFNPLHKVSRKLGKALGVGGGSHGRRSSVGGDLQHEDSRHGAGQETGIGENANGNSPQLHPAQSHHPEDKGFVQQISTGMENFFKAIVAENPKPMPVRTTVPEEEDDEDKKAEEEEAEKEPEVVLDENTPVPILLARIEYLETNLRAETQRNQGLEEQILQLEARCQEMERVIHTSLLSKILRPFRMCFGGRPEDQYYSSQQKKQY